MSKVPSDLATKKATRTHGTLDHVEVIEVWKNLNFNYANIRILEKSFHQRS
jgi:hypothetical protein